MPCNTTQQLVKQTKVNMLQAQQTGCCRYYFNVQQFEEMILLTRRTLSTTFGGASLEHWWNNLFQCPTS